MRKYFNKRTISYLAIFALVVSFGIFQVVSAEVESKEQKIRSLVSELESASPETRSIVLAALQDEASGKLGAVAVGGICNGGEPVSQLCNVNILDLEVEDFTVTGTSTPSVNTATPIVVTATFNATSTAVCTNSKLCYEDIAVYTNTGADLVCTNAYLDIETANGLLAYSFGGGITTVSGDGSLTNTSTVTTHASSTIATTSTLANDAGLTDYASSTPFVLANGQTFAMWWNPYTATSAASFTAAGGFTGDAKMHMICHSRGN
jgi:hypothetical protein